MGISSLMDRRLQVAIATALAGGAFAVAPAMASAATYTNITGSGSSLQNAAQLAWSGEAGADGAFGTSPFPTVTYTKTSSGAGLTEFALQGATPAITPTSSGNGSTLDAYIGTDVAPTSTALGGAATATGTDPETIPVISAPISVDIHLPSGCSVTVSAGHSFVTPVFLNADLSKAFLGTTSWANLLTHAISAAGATSAESESGCSTDTTGSGRPIIQVRSDSSGTSYNYKQYLDQFDSSWDSFVNDGAFGTTDAWPSNTQITDSYSGGTLDSGSGGEVAAVAATAGSIGYANLADAIQDPASGTFADWTSASQTTFLAKVQNQGNGTTGTQHGAEPDSGTTGNCPTVIRGTTTIPTGNNPDWSSVFVANFDLANSQNAHYSLCTMTFDIGWENYAATGPGSGNDDLAADYGGATAAANVGFTAQHYLVWATGTGTTQGQEEIPSYYSALPSNVQTAAHGTATSDLG